eukprot:CAMPEP_0182445062 /NCGR_PEP_ID=MMETSP1172-20130603/3317_1 /TAXON_ID=708627 /ORGANISM="Timspurckia oligopyrenoides, Strain CCMP3278" /LENGTH=587 /DNA_ID=CAMNT_0024640761 /DNA_START=584 /DNA_END=2344 /DNA_ORIENTATION=+
MNINVIPLSMRAFDPTRWIRIMESAKMHVPESHVMFYVSTLLIKRKNGLVEVFQTPSNATLSAWFGSVTAWDRAESVLFSCSIGKKNEISDAERFVRGLRTLNFKVFYVSPQDGGIFYAFTERFHEKIKEERSRNQCMDRRSVGLSRVEDFVSFVKFHFDGRVGDKIENENEFFKMNNRVEIEIALELSSQMISAPLFRESIEGFPMCILYDSREFIGEMASKKLCVDLSLHEDANGVKKSLENRFQLEFSSSSSIQWRQRTIDSDFERYHHRFELEIMSSSVLSTSETSLCLAVTKQNSKNSLNLGLRPCLIGSASIKSDFHKSSMIQLWKYYGIGQIMLSEVYDNRNWCLSAAGIRLNSRELNERLQFVAVPCRSEINLDFMDIWRSNSDVVEDNMNEKEDLNDLKIIAMAEYPIDVFNVELFVRYMNAILRQQGFETEKESIDKKRASVYIVYVDDTVDKKWSREELVDEVVERVVDGVDLRMNFIVHDVYFFPMSGVFERLEKSRLKVEGKNDELGESFVQTVMKEGDFKEMKMEENGAVLISQRSGESKRAYERLKGVLNQFLDQNRLKMNPEKRTLGNVLD